MAIDSRYLIEGLGDLIAAPKKRGARQYGKRMGALLSYLNKSFQDDEGQWLNRESTRKYLNRLVVKFGDGTAVLKDNASKKQIQQLLELYKTKALSPRSLSGSSSSFICSSTTSHSISLESLGSDF